MKNKPRILVLIIFLDTVTCLFTCKKSACAENNRHYNNISPLQNTDGQNKQNSASCPEEKSDSESPVLKQPIVPESAEVIDKDKKATDKHMLFKDVPPKKKNKLKILQPEEKGTLDEEGKLKFKGQIRLTEPPQKDDSLQNLKNKSEAEGSIQIDF